MPEVSLERLVEGLAMLPEERRPALLAAVQQAIAAAAP